MYILFKIYNLKFHSDQVQHHISIDGPQVGNWFAVAFVSWTDPSYDRIEQQGLSSSCDTLLLAELSVSRFHPIIINIGQIHNSTLTRNRDEQIKVNNNNERNNIENIMHNAEHLQEHNAKEDLQQLNGVDNVNNANNTTFSESSKGEIKAKAPVPKDFSTTETHTQMPLLVTATADVSHSPNTSTQTSESYNNTKSSTATTNNEFIYKFYVPCHVGVTTARITFGHVCPQCPNVGFHVQANAFPSIYADNEKNNENSNIHSTIIKPNETGEISIEFYVQPMTWHYALLTFVTSKNLIVNSTVGQNKQTEQVQSKKSEYFQMPKSHEESAAATSMTDENEPSTSYQLPFVFQIDYKDPSDNNEDSDIRKTVHKNDHIKGQYNENITFVNSSMDDTDYSDKGWVPKKFRGIDFYPVLRQTYSEFFMYDYDLVPDENGTVPTVINITAGIPVGFAFDVGEVYDIGGTLSFAVSVRHNDKTYSPESAKAMPSVPRTSERSGILAEKLIGNSDIISSNNSYIENYKKLYTKNFPRSNQTIIVCVHLGQPGKPTWPDKCRHGRRLLPAASIVNNTASNTSTGLVHVPFPESGQWYVTMGLYCHGTDTTSRAAITDSVKEFLSKYAHMLEYMRLPCACSSKFIRYRKCISDPHCLRGMNETDTLKVKECLLDPKCTSNHLEMTQKFEVHHKFATEQHFALNNCSASTVFTISSSPCVAGRCGRYGHCYHYMSGGFIFSTCVCIKGYRGWDCTEDSQVPSSKSILTASLLLTLSNLLFFPSIFIAGRRKFYTEAVIYLFTMLFSIFYHACDSGDYEYSFCFFQIGVLQFCDFYCGLLAIWVTLVAMCNIRQQFVSLLHMLGAILLAFGTELNKQSLWVFLAPALVGICLISASWGVRCYKSRKLFPGLKYLTVYMPLGIVLVVLGLICYAFLQTKQNYHIVHSVWHMVMALSILCLLPSRES